MVPSSYVKHFEGIPEEWHEVYEVGCDDKRRIKLFLRCKYPGCSSVFNKSCNLRDHFRKHTAQRPYKCELCPKSFTQSGNLGRHYKNIHKINRVVVALKHSPKIISKDTDAEKREDRKRDNSTHNTASVKDEELL